MSTYKPKVYRSTDGCCICKAKSSSSRFTDSGKYDEDCQSFFQLAEQRSGEICNACVLIVKRWKKLPRNTPKNWAHVVDARVGPGTKNIFKLKKKENPVVSCEKFKYKHVYKRRKSLKPRACLDESGNLSDSATSVGSVSPGFAPGWQPYSFLDNSYWSQQVICCGLVYVGELGEVMLDRQMYRPCSGASSHHTQRIDTKTSTSPQTTPCLTSKSSPNSTFSSTLNPSSIESLVEAELQAFQAVGAEPEEEEFYVDAKKIITTDELNSSNDFEGDEGFCDRLDQKSEQFPGSISVISTH